MLWATQANLVLLSHIFVDFRVPLPPPWAKMLNFRLFRVPFLVEFGAVVDRESGNPHNVLGYCFFFSYKIDRGFVVKN